MARIGEMHSLPPVQASGAPSADLKPWPGKLFFRLLALLTDGQQRQ